MAHKTFISYKYSEASFIRDKIISSLGADATFYRGERSDSPDLTDTSTSNIKKNLADMMYQTSVTIVVISPNLKKSKWVDWEIEYSLKDISRKNRTSHTNGVLGVIMKFNGSYDWLKATNYKADGCVSTTYNEDFLYPIINNNRYNQTPKKYSCVLCKSVDSQYGSYISLIEEETFLNNPQKYIEIAYEKSEKATRDYVISKTR